MYWSSRVQMRKNIRVSGTVQGVGFRWFVLKHARKLGLVGWVRNNPDGSVEIEAQGTSETVESLIGDVRRGPRFSRVESVNSTDIVPLGKEKHFRVVF